MRTAHRETSEVAFSQAIFAAMQVYIPWLAASRAPLTDLAMLSLAQSIVWPLSMIAQLQLRNIYLVQGERSLLPLFVQLRLASCVFLVAAVAAATGLLGSGTLLLTLALALALIKCVENVSDIVHGELQRAMEVTRASRSQTVRCAIFIGVYTVGMVSSGHLFGSLAAACAAMAVWVLAVDVPRKSWRRLIEAPARAHDLTSTLKAGVSLSLAVALTSLSLMVGRWAAMRAGDMETLAAAALAGTAASLVAVVIGATLQFSLTQARARLAAGGVQALDAWSRPVAWRLHTAFAGLALAWVTAAVVIHDVAPRLATPSFHLGMQDTVLALAGCYLAGGWLSVLCFADTLRLQLTGRNGAILFTALVQVVAAGAASLLLYPLLGWVAIGIAELARGAAFIASMKYLARRIAP